MKIILFLIFCVLPEAILSYSCFGIDSASTTVCNGNGICVDKDVCNCKTFYTGIQCETPICYNFPSNDPFVCSIHGQCASPNNCICDPLYGGSKCDIPKCFGVLANSPSVCNGQGECIGPDLCVCTGGLFRGVRCQIPFCFGLYGDQANVCNGNGVCYWTNSCACNSMYTGLQCNIPKCFGTFANVLGVCSGNGECVNGGSCVCKNLYTGMQCEFPSCYGLFSNNAQVCSSNGVCESINNCKCNPGYTGLKCNIPICYGINGNDPSVCTNGNGGCISPNNCQCKANIFGAQCNIYSCYGVLANNGLVCSSAGLCLGVDNCVCAPGYTGLNCQIKICKNILSTDPNVCNRLGTCVSPNQCQCNAGVSGQNCEIFSCFNFPKDDPNVCSGSGQCTFLDTCVCRLGYLGENCNLTNCFGIQSNETNVCNSAGSCVGFNNCNCTSSGYSGDRCENALCFGVTDPVAVCNGKGACVSTDLCNCFSGHTGSQCELFTCNNILRTDTNVCNSRGRCIGPNECECDEGYEDEDCSRMSPLGDACEVYSEFTEESTPLFGIYRFNSINVALIEGPGGCNIPEKKILLLRNTNGDTIHYENVVIKTTQPVLIHGQINPFNRKRVRLNGIHKISSNIISTVNFKDIFFEVNTTSSSSSTYLFEQTNINSPVMYDLVFDNVRSSPAVDRVAGFINLPNTEALKMTILNSIFTDFSNLSFDKEPIITVNSNNNNVNQCGILTINDIIIRRSIKERMIRINNQKVIGFENNDLSGCTSNNYLTEDLFNSCVYMELCSNSNITQSIVSRNQISGIILTVKDFRREVSLNVFVDFSLYSLLTIKLSNVIETTIDLSSNYIIDNIFTGLDSVPVALRIAYDESFNNLFKTRDSVRKLNLNNRFTGFSFHETVLGSNDKNIINEEIESINLYCSNGCTLFNQNILVIILTSSFVVLTIITFIFTCFLKNLLFCCDCDDIVRRNKEILRINQLENLYNRKIKKV